MVKDGDTIDDLKGVLEAEVDNKEELEDAVGLLEPRGGRGGGA